MIRKDVLLAFGEYMKSGQFEEDFSFSAEDRRSEMLELLELFMDISDEVDIVATRVIFKGIGAVSAPKSSVLDRQSK